MYQVLVVEDDADLRASVAAILQEDGHTVRAVNNGQEAMDALAEGELPRVIVLDLLMPVMDGWKVAAALQADPALAQIPVVVASVAADERVADLADAVIRKPFPLERLLQVVRGIVGTPGAPERAARPQTGFQPGPRLRALVERMRLEERTGRRMGFWVAPNAAERLAAAIQADLRVGELSDPVAAPSRFRFGPHARLELTLMHFDADDADALEQAVSADLAEVTSPEQPAPTRRTAT